jgi:hypothetical protein
MRQCVDEQKETNREVVGVRVAEAAVAHSQCNGGCWLELFIARNKFC